MAAMAKMLPTGVDPGFEIGGVHKSAHESFFSVPHSLSSPQPGLGTLDTIITIGINKHEVVEN